MDMFQRVLLVDPKTGFYKTKRYSFDRYFGPVDLGMHMAEMYRSLNFGVGVFAGSVLPGSNRLLVTGFSPCWQGNFISSMGGAGLVFDNLGINMLSLVGKAPVHSVLYLNRNHGEEIEVEIVPVDAEGIWRSGRTGVYSLTDRVFEMFGNRYENDPRILVTGPAALETDMGGIMSVPIKNDKISYEVKSGLTQDAAKYLKRRYKRSIENVNKFPKTMNFFRGHMLCLIDKENQKN